MVDKLYIKVHGNVQGVGFRYQVVTFSTGYELTGFARNLTDGSVEVFAEGPKENLKKLIDYIKGSPGSSQVTEVEPTWKDPANREYSKFFIKF
jgi:acylphosphatase